MREASDAVCRYVRLPGKSFRGYLAACGNRVLIAHQLRTCPCCGRKVEYDAGEQEGAQE